MVDDQPVLCNVAALLLRRCGYRVLTADGADAAKRIAGENHVDLLLTDVEMPEKPNHGLAAWFQTSRPETEIVFMTGDATRARRPQPCHFVEKPFIHLDALVKEIREALNHGRTEVAAAAAAA